MLSKFSFTRLPVGEISRARLRASPDRLREVEKNFSFSDRSASVPLLRQDWLKLAQLGIVEREGFLRVLSLEIIVPGFGQAQRRLEVLARLRKAAPTIIA